MSYIHKLAESVREALDIDKLDIDSIYPYFVQEHATTRKNRKPHYDFRIGDPNMGLASWAIPKARLPEDKEKLLAIQTPIHDYDYGKFTGSIGKGYGEGRVTLKDTGKAKIVGRTSNSVSFILNPGENQKKYTLVFTKEPDKYILLKSKQN